MSKKSSKDEIVIPTPINRAKNSNDNITRVEHPSEESKVVVTSKKKSENRFKDRSRFAPKAIPVEVPSKGYLYKSISDDSEVKNGIIRISPITSEEEKILTTQRFIEQGIALDMILENCIQSDIDPYDLLSTDRMYLLFYLRGMSYDLSYDFNVKCYSCGHNFIQNIRIDKLPIDIWDSENKAREPVIIHLPISNATVEAHYMRGKEEKEMMEKSRKLKSFDEPDDRATDSLIYLIDKVTLDSGEILGPNDKSDFINNLIGGDCDEFRTQMIEKECGIRQLEDITCPKCSFLLQFSVPIGRNFFRRQRR